MSELTIREMGQDEDFSAWFSELLEQEDATTAGSAGGMDEHYLILSNEIGDWIGGLRYWLRGGVAHLVDVVVLPQERHRGHAHRLMAAFEERAAEAGGHVAEFWTDDQRSEGLLGALGWRRIFQREDYIGHRGWSLMEKRLGTDPQ
jgi:ribosomal protein S18 acetylase RimI-like enzyme